MQKNIIDLIKFRSIKKKKKETGQERKKEKKGKLHRTTKGQCRGRGLQQQ